MSRTSYDLRPLAAPEPMMRIIMAFDALAGGAEWEILADEPGRFVLLVKKAA